MLMEYISAAQHPTTKIHYVVEFFKFTGSPSSNPETEFREKIETKEYTEKQYTEAVNATIRYKAEIGKNGYSLLYRVVTLYDLISFQSIK